MNIFLQIIYGPSESWHDENTKDTKITSSSETILHGLKKFTNYSMQILAFTSGGDGVKSAPIHCQTEQDGSYTLPLFITLVHHAFHSILISYHYSSRGSNRYQGSGHVCRLHPRLLASTNST